MFEVAQEYRKKVENALLIGIKSSDESEAQVCEYLDELADLVKNLDIKAFDERIIAPVYTPSNKYFVGEGKANEIAALADELDAHCIVFDISLSPSQQRNWERLTKKCVIDREEIILDIFAERASSREAVLQIELAKAQYSLPRLTRAWTHLSRQHGGGATTRGEGETQIETDRRLLRNRIQQLKKELEKVRKQRNTQRKSRDKGNILHGAIVGYTNVGKSSLLNALADSDVLVKDQLFATLDPTTRRVTLENYAEILLTDTVGFVRKLPHALVESFKSTLEEAVLADFLLLVLDISSPYLEEQWETTIDVLKELGAEEKNIVIVFNKVDKVAEEDKVMLFARVRGLFPDAFYVSVRNKKGLDELKQRLTEMASEKNRILQLLIPPDRHDLIAFAHAKGNVFDENYQENGDLQLTVNIDVIHHHRFKGYTK